jgi:hypothetical protein
MRIEGELLKLRISVSATATAIATVLRASGLGPAPRRIGPSWSDFLRAQAHSMIGEDRRAAMRGNALERDARKPSAPAEDAERELEADDNPPWATPSSLAWPLTRCLSGGALGERYRAFSLRHEDRCVCGHPIDRTLATDPRAGHRLAQSRVLSCDGKTIADRAAVRINPASDALGNLPGSSDLRGGRNIGHHPELPSRIQFLYPTGLLHEYYAIAA